MEIFEGQKLVEFVEIGVHMVLSLKGCQIVAGGRSEAKTTGEKRKVIPHLEQVPEKPWHPSGVQKNYQVFGGLRYAATTGYYLTAFLAETRSLPSSFYLVSLFGTTYSIHPIIISS